LCNRIEKERLEDVPPSGLSNPGREPSWGNPVFTAAIDWGDGNQSDGTIADDGNGGFTVSGTNTYDDHGTYDFTITIGDGGNAAAVVTGAATISDAAFSAAAQACAWAAVPG
jgi:hypothetical protein